MTQAPHNIHSTQSLSPEKLSQLGQVTVEQTGHINWIADALRADLPCPTLAAFKQKLASIVLNASPDDQTTILCAQAPAALAGDMRAQVECYQSRFGWPYVVASAGPRRTGLSAQALAMQLARRLSHPLEHERRTSLLEVLRGLELRFDEICQGTPELGDQLWDWHESLAVHTEGQDGALTVTYMTPVHQQVARDLADRMQACGCDEVRIDDLGNVVGIYHGTDRGAPRLLTGSHYDTVRNGGKYDGRLGILLPLACIDLLYKQGIRPSRDIEVIAFSEEEGQRFAATFLASSAVTGQFNEKWLEQLDADGISMRQAIERAGHRIEGIAGIRRDPRQYAGFVEVHIEQGPVLNNLGLPLGVVTSINGGVRFKGQVRGLAGHAGTTPMRQRQDAACAAARIVLLAQDCALDHPGSVATVGMLNVPNGSINVIPGLCDFSLDVRAPSDELRNTVIDKIMEGIRDIEASHGVSVTLTETMRVAAAPSDLELQRRWGDAVTRLGLPVYRLASGAGHDAMKLATIMPQAMLFVRGEHNGISHNPLESTTSHDMELAIAAMLHLIQTI